MDFKNFLHSDKATPDKILNFEDYLAQKNSTPVIIEPVVEPVTIEQIPVVEPVEPVVETPEV